VKHNSVVYVDAYLQMGRRFVQLLSRTMAFDNVCLSLENKCLNTTHMSLEMYTVSLFLGIHSILCNYTQNYILGHKNIHQT